MRSKTKHKELKIPLTPITEQRLIDAGFEKVIEKDRDASEYAYVIRLPKESPDPHCMCLVSSYTTEYKEYNLKEGEFVVEVYDSGGLGMCASMEELDMLYFVLTRKPLL
jgi:hypothetical protein